LENDDCLPKPKVELSNDMKRQIKEMCSIYD